ncbi:MAG: site-specific integrase [Proteobacteria bacterium]|nr:site-specific integrase [Pseudomonadota bacterium]
MPRQTRHSTEFSGVYFVKLANENQSFFIRYKRNGKSVEEKAGHSNEGWDAEIACLLRAERMAGTEFQQRKFQHDSDLNASQLWTFSKIFEKYLRLRPDLKGRENDIYRFKNYLELDFADIAPEVVTHGDVERFRHNLQNKGLKPATVRHVLELLRRLANFAVKKNYCRGLSFKLEMPKVENQKTEELTHDQLQKLMRVLEEDPDLQVSNLVRMVLYTGMRRGELFELCWSDIDFYNKIITVRSGKNVQHPTIPLNEMAEKVLAEHAHVEGSSKFVFPGRGGKKRTECKRPLLRIRKNAGLPDDFRLLQGLRHVYATKLVSSGKVDLETLQSLLTQKSPLMTQRYAHLLDQTVDFTGTEIASDNSETFATEPVAEIPKTVIASDYNDVEGTEEVQAIEIATDYTDVEETEEVPAIEIATDYTENADTESVEEITDTVVASNYTHVEGTEEVTAMDIATDYTDMGESAEIADVVIATDNMDSESNEGVQPTVKVQESSDIEIAKKNMDSVQQEELEETESETKTPELSQLVKQNYTAFKPTEIHQREVYSSKNIVVDNKVANHVEEKSAQQNARPSLKDLKNDLKSLSQLIQAAPRRSKVTTAKRNLN